MRDLRAVIINPATEDYHMHSLNYSDGMNTIDEIVQFAGKIGLKKIAITDHSQFVLDMSSYYKKSPRTLINKWINVHNDLEVIFGVEGDLLDSKGNICIDIQGAKGNFNILSYHPESYSKDKTTVVEGFVNAMQNHRKDISLIGHVCLGINNNSAEQIISEANKYQIPLELDSKYFIPSPNKWRVLLDNADRMYINSDAHTLHELRDSQKKAREILQDMGYKI